MTDREHVQRWLDDYVSAWKSYDREEIAALFADDVEYRYHPYDEPIRGRDAVVESWVTDDPDASGTYEGAYRPVAVDGDLAVATGVSRYTNEEGAPRATFHNCFVIRFDGEGRCREFTEWYVLEPG